MCAVDADGGTNAKPRADEPSVTLASFATTLGSERPTISSGSSGASAAVALSTAAWQSSYETKSGNTGPVSESRLISMQAKSGSGCPIAGTPAGAPAAVSSLVPGTMSALSSHDSL